MNRLSLTIVARDEICWVAIAAPTFLAGIIWGSVNLKLEPAEPAFMFPFLLLFGTIAACAISFRLSQPSLETGSLTDVVLIRSGPTSVVVGVVILGAGCGLLSMTPINLIWIYQSSEHYRSLEDGFGLGSLVLVIGFISAWTALVGAASGVWWGLRDGEQSTDFASAAGQSVFFLIALLVAVTAVDPSWIMIIPSGMVLVVAVLTLLLIRRLRWSCASGR